MPEYYSDFWKSVYNSINGLYRNITTATTTTVKSGAGTLHKIIINLSAAGTITIYDNTAGSGAKIATIKASASEGHYDFNCKFTTGLTIVTGAATEITAIYT